MTDVLNPKALTLPSIPVANQATAGKTGSIGMSGSQLVVYDGSAWKIVTVS